MKDLCLAALGNAFTLDDPDHFGNNQSASVTALRLLIGIPGILIDITGIRGQVSFRLRNT